MQKPRSKAKLIADLMAFANTPITGKGGWPNRLRAVQRLCLQAGLQLGEWGRHGAPKAFRTAQAGDLFTPGKEPS